MHLQMIWRFAAWVAGCSIPTGIVLYVTSKLAKSAGDRITHAMDAYTGEQAKLTAQFHNLGRLIEQTEKLTTATEVIKAQISNEIWDRQMRWTSKRDSYIELMVTLGERHDVEGRNKLLEQIHRNDPGNKMYPIELDRAMLRSQEVQARMVRVACVAPLLVSPEAHRVLIETTNALKKVRYDHPKFEADSDHNLQVLQDGLNKLLTVARQDLDASIVLPKAPSL